MSLKLVRRWSMWTMVASVAAFYPSAWSYSNSADAATWRIALLSIVSGAAAISGFIFIVSLWLTLFSFLKQRRSTKRRTEPNLRAGSRNNTSMHCVLPATFVFLATLLQIWATPASGGNEKAPGSRLENLLNEMGYVDVDVDTCVIQFRRVLPNQCPTDKPLSYWRSVDLRNLDMQQTSGIQEMEDKGRIWNFFSIAPTPTYYHQTNRIVDFLYAVKTRHPTSDWPFRYDEAVPLIREEFYRAFPKSENMNWWISETCFGESPMFYADFIMSSKDLGLLEDFRLALIDYGESGDCNLERSSNGS